MSDPVDDVVELLNARSGLCEADRAEQDEQLRAALKRWVKREVRHHALSGEEPNA